MLIIGAGPVGLGMANALKAEGIAYDQVDADDDVGGNWKHGVWDTAHIISSRKTTEFADFPMPADYPDFPSRANMLDYLNAYADHFDLRDAIAFNTKVVWVQPVADNRWQVTFESGEERVYKGVLACNGHHWQKRWPSYPGHFDGQMIHSKDFKHPDQLNGKRVLVIGGGNSACDVASEAARVATRADLSIRRGYWFLPKVLFGIPLAEWIRPWMPVWSQRLLIRAALKVAVGDYRRYGLPRPDHRIFDHHPTISTEVLHYLKHGRIRPRPDIARFDGGRVTFTDGSSDAYDMIVAATGFHVSYPFLPAALTPVDGPVVKVYGGSMLKDYRHLYLIGWGQPRYGFGPLVTPASRLMARLIRLQDDIDYPLGQVMAAMGDKPPTTHLADPHKQIRQVRRAMKRLWLIKLVARRLMRAPARPNAPIDEPVPSFGHNAEPLVVY